MEAVHELRFPTCLVTLGLGAEKYRYPPPPSPFPVPDAPVIAAPLIRTIRPIMTHDRSRCCSSSSPEQPSSGSFLHFIEPPLLLKHALRGFQSPRGFALFMADFYFYIRMTSAQHIMADCVLEKRMFGSWGSAEGFETQR